MEKTKILVWDLPVRVFHWLLVVSFAGAFLTAESERVRDVHVALGYTFAGLLAFRLVWGFVGTRYARFRSFAFGPGSVLRYLKSLSTRQPAHYVGHNPAGSWMIYAIVALGLATAASGYALYVDAGGKWIEPLHEGVANVMLALAIFHVAGVAVSSILHRENLAAAMVTGHKAGQPSEAIGGSRWATAMVVAAMVTLLWSGFVEFPGAFSPAANATVVKEHAPSHHSRHRPGRHDG